MINKGDSNRENINSSLRARISELEKENNLLKASKGSIVRSDITSLNNSDLSVLLSITMNLLETREKRKVLLKIIEGAIQLIGLDTGALYSLDGENLHLETTVPPLSEDYPDEFRKAWLKNHPHIRKAVKSKSPVLINDMREAELSDEERVILNTREMCSVLYIPLLLMNKVIGVLILGTVGRRYEFRERELYLCHTLSNIGSLALENSILFEQSDRNISELKKTLAEKDRSEKRIRLLRRAVEQSPVSIVVTDYNGIIEYVNPKFTSLTGFSSEEAIGKNPRIMNSGHHTRDFYKDMWVTLRSGREWLGEMKNKKKNGEFYWESVLISPMTDENGRITHYIGVKEDITEKKVMLENLISAKEKAEESDRLKTAFIHNISHEIRTPLNAIVGFSTFMNDPDLPSEKRRTYRDIIISSNDQLLYIIDGIMKVSHLETGQVKLVKSKSDIRRITQALYNQFKPVAAARNIRFALDNGNVEEGTTMLTDEGKVKQILSNLLDNAFKFTEEGLVDFGCYMDGDTIQFSVGDTGIGISEHEHERIFERFYQAAKPDSQVYSGTGIGLSICSGYASLLGGTLKVKSAPGSGSVFTLTLPFQRN